MSADEEKSETMDLQPEKMKVNELKTLLNERGLDTKGVKAVLVSRLRQALADGGRQRLSVCLRTERTDNLHSKNWLFSAPKSLKIEK